MRRLAESGPAQESASSALTECLMRSSTPKTDAIPSKTSIGAPVDCRRSSHTSYRCHSPRLCSCHSGLGRVFLFSFYLLNPETNAIKLGRSVGRLDVTSVPLGVTLIELARVPAVFPRDRMRKVRDLVDVETSHSDAFLYRVAAGSGTEPQEVVAQCVSFCPGNVR